MRKADEMNKETCSIDYETKYKRLQEKICTCKKKMERN